METQKINGIVVSSTKYKDFDVLCSVLTDSGIKKIKFTGARRSNAKMAYAAQPFFCGEFIVSGAKDYAVVTQVSQTNDFYSLTTDYDTFLFAAEILKIASKISTNDSTDLLQLVLISLSALKIDNINLLTIQNFFYIKILQVLGVWSMNFVCSLCGKDLQKGALVNENSGEVFCKNCGNVATTAISSNVCEYLSSCCKKQLSELVDNEVSEGIKKKANEILKKIVQNQI